MKPQQVEEPDGTRHAMAPIVVNKLATALHCAVPECESWWLGRSKNQSHEVTKVQAVPEKKGILNRDKYEVWDFFFTDQ